MPRKPSKKTIANKLDKAWRKYNDLSGKRFGRLFVERRDDGNHPRPYYLCQCDCGNKKVICGTSLTRKTGASRSCGCLNRYSKILPEGHSNRNRLFDLYRRGAIQRGYSFKLSESQFLDLIAQDCHYCGSEPSNVLNHKGSNGSVIYNGIDRKNNKIGYTASNCLPCCKLCNMMKHSASYEGFLEQVFKIYNECLIWEEE